MQDSDYPELGSKKILVIDDDDFVRESTVFFLKSYNVEVVAVSNLSDALRIFSKQKFNLVILDLYLPNRAGGIAAYLKLRKNSASLPILLVSGEPVSLKEAIFDGDIHVSFLQKPYDPIIFLNRLLEMGC